MIWKASSARHLTQVAVLAAVGIVLQVVESFVPLPVPFLKIGLANIASLVALVVWSPRDMVIVLLTRVIAGALILGSLLSPSFLISLSSGLAAAAAMWAAYRGPRRIFSVVGISLIGSVTHVMVQLLVVSLLIVQDPSLLVLLPLLLLTALVGGLVVGLISLKLVPVLQAGR